MRFSVTLFTLLAFSSFKEIVSLKVHTNTRRIVAKPGDSIIFICSIDKSLQYCRMEIKGFDKARVLNPNKNKPGDRVQYPAGLSFERGQCGLNLTNIDEKNNGPVRCTLNDKGSVESSQTMTLVVARTPSPPELKYLPPIPSSDHFNEGDIIRLSCTVRKGRPPANLTWKIGEESIYDGLSFIRTVRDKIDLYTVSQNITRTLQASDNGKEIKCIANHVALTPTNNQKAIRLRVNYANSSEVRTNTRYIVAKPGESILFICSINKPLEYCRMEIPGFDEEKSLGPNKTKPGDRVQYPAGLSLERGQCGLNLTKIDENNNGPIRCTLNDEGSVESNQTMTLVVARAPSPPELKHLSGVPSSGHFNEGDVIRLGCTVSKGRPAAKLTWKIGQESIHDGLSLISTEREVNDLYTVSQNITRTLQASDNGKEIKCIANHVALPSPKNQKTTRLRVNYAPKPWEKPYEQLGLVEGQDGKVVVVIQAFPKPNISWNIGTEQIYEGRTDQANKYEVSRTVNKMGDFWETTLKINNLSQEDIKRTYYVKAINPSGKESYEVLISTSTKPRYVVSHEVQTNTRYIVAKPGESILFICSIDKPLEYCRMEITGFNEARVLGPNKNKPGDRVQYPAGLSFERGQCGLNLTNIHEKNNGPIRCTLNDGDTVESSQTMTLVVARTPSPPELKYLPSIKTSNHSKEGDIVRLSCTVSKGRPAANLTWKIGEESIYDGLSFIRTVRDKIDLYTVSQNITRTLQASDNGKEIKCIANHVGSAPQKNPKATRLRVNYAPKPWEKPYEQLGLIEGQEVKVVVVIQAFPKPNISWNIGTEQILERQTDQANKYEVSRTVYKTGDFWKTALKINTLSQEDINKNYYVKASNIVGNETYEVYISTSAAPRYAVSDDVRTNTRYIVAKPGDSILFICTIDKSLQYCRMEIKGFDEAKPLGPNRARPGDRAQYPAGLSFERGQCGLNLTNIDENNNGLIKCTLNGGESVESSQTMTLVVARAPSPPELKYLPSIKTSNHSKEGDIVRLSCTVSKGRPAANLTWKIGEESIYDGLSSISTVKEDYDLYTVSQNLTRTLQASDNGKEIKCIANHVALAPPNNQKTTRLRVNYAPKPWEKPYEQLGLVEGQEGKVVVVIQAFPKPNISWNIGTEQIFERQTDQANKYEVSRTVNKTGDLWKTALKINNLSQEDIEKTYYVKASNIVGNETYKVYISTSAAPRCIVEKS